MTKNTDQIQPGPLDEIRASTSILEIARRYTTLKPGRREGKWAGRCPFCNAPQFTVDDAKQLYHCFGCGAGGDVFSLVMEREGLTFVEAVARLAGEASRRKPSPDPELERAAMALIERGAK